MTLESEVHVNDGVFSATVSVITLQILPPPIANQFIFLTFYSISIVCVLAMLDDVFVGGCGIIVISSLIFNGFRSESPLFTADLDEPPKLLLLLFPDDEADEEPRLLPSPDFFATVLCAE